MIVTVVALVLVAVAGGAYAALGGSSTSAAWPAKDVHSFHQTCRAGGTSTLTCNQEIACAEKNVQAATFENFYQDRNTADGKRLSHCLQSVPYRARYSRACLNSWNTWLQASGIGAQIGSTDATASLSTIGAKPSTQTCAIVFVASSQAVTFINTGTGAWTLMDATAPTATDKRLVANVVLNPDGTLTAMPTPVATQPAATQGATPQQQHCVDQWNAGGLGSYYKGKATVLAGPCVVVWFAMMPDGSINAVFPCDQSGVSYTCPEHGDDPSYAKKVHPEWLKTNAHFMSGGKLALDHPPPGGSTQGVQTPDLPTDNGYLIPVQADGTLYPGITVTKVLPQLATCATGSESAPAPAMRCFAGDYVVDPCFTNPQPAARGQPTYCPTGAGVKTVVQITIKKISPY